MYSDFSACESEKDSVERGVCSFLRSHVELTKANQVFMLGQPYKITLFLEVPESDANKAIGKPLFLSFWNNFYHFSGFHDVFIFNL